MDQYQKELEFEQCNVCGWKMLQNEVCHTDENGNVICDDCTKLDDNLDEAINLG